MDKYDYYSNSQIGSENENILIMSSQTTTTTSISSQFSIPSIPRLDNLINNSQTKKEHFRSKMKTQLTLSNNGGVSLKQKLRTQQTLDFNNNYSNNCNNQSSISQQDEFYFHYEELEKIGEGCHSVVKKCQNKETKKIYAVKIIRTDDIEIIKQAQQEYDIIKDLNHENILKMHELFINERTGYVRIISEYSDALTLKKYTEKSANKCLTEQLACKIAQQILSAMNYLHKNNIVHRDIKPSNILIHPESLHITLIDFGISRIFDNNIEMCTPTGTPLYKSPEIIRGDPYNNNTDSWALGITLFEILVGQKPFSFTYTESEMVSKMERQSFTNNIRYKNLSINCQDFLKQLLDPDNNSRITAKEGLKHQFITRMNNDNPILQQQDLNLPLQSINNSFNTPKKQQLGGLSEITPNSCNNNNNNNSSNKYSFQSTYKSLFSQNSLNTNNNNNNANGNNNNSFCSNNNNNNSSILSNNNNSNEQNNYYAK